MDLYRDLGPAAFHAHLSFEVHLSFAHGSLDGCGLGLQPAQRLRELVPRPRALVLEHHEKPERGDMWIHPFEARINGRERRQTNRSHRSH